jgi:MFS family permease
MIKLRSSEENQTRLPFKTSFFYGWVITAIGALAYFFTGPGQTHFFSTFVDPMLTEFGWSRSLISGIYSGGTLLAGLMLFITGYLVERFGCRLMLSLVALFLAGSCFFMGKVTGPVILFTGVVLIRFFGIGSLELIPAVLIPQWFRRKQGQAFWVISLGLAIGTALFPPVNVILIRLWGWRNVWWFWGIILIAVLAPLAWALVRNRPEDVGLLPDNELRKEDGVSIQISKEKSWPLFQVKRTSSFWIILVASSIPYMVVTGLRFHQLSILAKNGLSIEVASSVFMVTAVIQLIILAPAGWFADRFDNRYLLSITLLLLAISTIFVIWTDSPLLAVLLGILQGCTLGLNSIVVNTIWPNYYGRGFLARIRGFSITVMIAGSALGPMPFGMAFDQFNGYREIVFIMSAFSLLAAGIVLFIHPPEIRHENK